MVRMRGVGSGGSERLAGWHRGQLGHRVSGADGGIQVLATDNTDLVIDMNGYYVQATTVIGPSGPQGPIGNAGATGAASIVPGPPGATGPMGAPGATGPKGATGSSGSQGPIGNSGAAGGVDRKGHREQRCSGSHRTKGPIGNSGAAGGIGPQGPIKQRCSGSYTQGPIGNNGAAAGSHRSPHINGRHPECRALIGNDGAAGGIGPQGPIPERGAAKTGCDYGGIIACQFFALMPPDNAATVAVGADVSFPQDGPISSGSAISRISSSTFNLSAIGTYQVMFQVSVNEPGQLNLTLNGDELAYTVVGRATGTNQLAGMSLVTTTVINSILTVRNPAGNSTALTITPLAGGTSPVSAHLVITQIPIVS